MGTEPCTSSGVLDPSLRNAPNSHQHQDPSSHNQGNNGTVKPSIGPYQHQNRYPYYDTSGDFSYHTDSSISTVPIFGCQTHNNMINNQPHAAGSHYTRVNAQEPHHLQSGQSHIQSFAPMYPGCGPGINHNEMFNVPSQNAQSNNTVGHLNGLPHPLHSVNPGGAPQLPGTHRDETFHDLKNTKQDNEMVAPQNGRPEIEPFHGKLSEVPPTYSSLYANQIEASTTAPHHLAQNGANVPPHAKSNGVYQANTWHHYPTLSEINNGGARNSDIESHDPDPWAWYPSMGQNFPAHDHRSDLPQSMNQHITSTSMDTAPGLATACTHQNHVERSNRGALQGSPSQYQAEAVVPLANGPPPTSHSGAPASDPVNLNSGIPEYRAEVNLGFEIYHPHPSNAQAPDMVSGSGTVAHPNPSNGGFNMPPSSNIMCSGVQAPNGADTWPPSNPKLPSFHQGQCHNPANGNIQPISHLSAGDLGGSYARQYQNATTPGSQNGVTNGQALGFQAPHTSNVAHSSGAHPIPRGNTGTGSNGGAHEVAVRPPSVQYPCSVPVPATLPNRQAPGYDFDMHFLQTSILERPPSSNARIEDVHTNYTTVAYPVPGHPRPANGHVNESDSRPANGYELSLIHGQNQQPQAKKWNDRGLMLMVNDGGNRKTRARKRRPPRKTREGKGDRYEASGTYPKRMQPNGRCGKAPMTAEISLLRTGHYNGCDGAPSGLLPLQPNGLPLRRPNGLLDLQPNGLPKVPTSLEKPLGPPTSLHESNSSAQHVNGCHRENDAHIYATKLQDGSGDLHPGPSALGVPAQPAPVRMTVALPPNGSAVQNNDVGIAPSMNCNSWDLDEDLLPADQTDDHIEGFQTRSPGFQQKNAEKSGEDFASALLTDSMPFKTPPKDLANRAAGVVQQGQATTVLMNVIQPDTDALFHEKMKRIDHEHFPGLPGQMQWPLRTSSTCSGAENFRLDTPPGDGGKERPGSGKKTAVRNLEVPA
ncbi:hypothetical protein ACJ72_02138 [Emergomyces africanus]|uniref:Uncharacterized protein n=1 Tax=Emergomyces africanus TaxID=1955775 RepID=A0A1B7P3B7_9EURO|nr:hypothetical protein ACJ72_02138 [Emergomyces africanus]